MLFDKNKNDSKIDVVEIEKHPFYHWEPVYLEATAVNIFKKNEDVISSEILDSYKLDCDMIWLYDKNKELVGVFKWTDDILGVAKARYLYIDHYDKVTVI